MGNLWILMLGLGSGTVAAVLISRHAARTRKVSLSADDTTRDALESVWANRTAVTLFLALALPALAAVVVIRPSIWVVLGLAAMYVFLLGPILLVSAESYRHFFFPRETIDNGKT